MAMAPGLRLGSYEASALIGSGGMGEVYRAQDIKLDRDVALKILPEAFAANLQTQTTTVNACTLCSTQWGP